jgi:hypothetical protein
MTTSVVSTGYPAAIQRQRPRAAVITATATITAHATCTDGMADICAESRPSEPYTDWWYFIAVSTSPVPPISRGGATGRYSWMSRLAPVTSTRTVRIRR